MASRWEDETEGPPLVTRPDDNEEIAEDAPVPPSNDLSPYTTGSPPLQRDLLPKPDREPQDRSVPRRSRRQAGRFGDFREPGYYRKMNEGSHPGQNFIWVLFSIDDASGLWPNSAAVEKLSSTAGLCGIPYAPFVGYSTAFRIDVCLRQSIHCCQPTGTNQDRQRAGQLGAPSRPALGPAAPFLQRKRP